LTVAEKSTQELQAIREKVAELMQIENTIKSRTFVFFNTSPFSYSPLEMPIPDDMKEKTKYSIAKTEEEIMQQLLK
jgi:hypothetical protein